MTKARNAGEGRVAAPRQTYRVPRRELRGHVPGAKPTMVDDCWRSRLHQLIDTHGIYKGDGRTPVSNQTRHNRRYALSRLFEVLHERYPLRDPANIDARHIRFLDAWMEERYHNHLAKATASLSPATISGYKSHLKQFCNWIGQPKLASMVGEGFSSPAVSMRSCVAKSDRSWEGCGIDVGAKVDEAAQHEPWMGMVLLAQISFGLRCKEAVCLSPAKAWNRKFTLRITEGAKGGRARSIKLWEDGQFEVLAVLCAWLAEERRPNAALGGGQGTLVQNLRRYEYVMRAIGITRQLTGTSGHGLRTGFACRLLADFGVTAPVRGGDLASTDQGTVRAAYAETSAALGHSRLGIVNAYGGSTRRGAHLAANALDECEPPDLAAIVARLQAHRLIQRDVVPRLQGPIARAQQAIQSSAAAAEKERWPEHVHLDCRSSDSHEAEDFIEEVPT